MKILLITFTVILFLCGFVALGLGLGYPIKVDGAKLDDQYFPIMQIIIDGNKSDLIGYIDLFTINSFVNLGLTDVSSIKEWFGLGEGIDTNFILLVRLSIIGFSLIISGIFFGLLTWKVKWKKEYKTLTRNLSRENDGYYSDDEGDYEEIYGQ